MATPASLQLQQLQLSMIGDNPFAMQPSGFGWNRFGLGSPMPGFDSSFKDVHSGPREVTPGSKGAASGTKEPQSGQMDTPLRLEEPASGYKETPSGFKQPAPVLLSEHVWQAELDFGLSAQRPFGSPVMADGQQDSPFSPPETGVAPIGLTPIDVKVCLPPKQPHLYAIR